MPDLSPADQLAAFEAKHPPGSLAPGPHSAIVNLIWTQAATYDPESDAFTFNPAGRLLLAPLICERADG